MQTTTFLAEMCGTNAFDVVTLEEAILLGRYHNYGFTATIVKVAARGGGLQKCL